MSEEAKELIAFMRSNENFFYGTFIPTVEKLKADRHYDHLKQERTTWRRITLAAARDYVKQFSVGPVSNTFPDKVIKEVAKALAHEFLTNYFKN